MGNAGQTIQKIYCNAQENHKIIIESKHDIISKHVSAWVIVQSNHNHPNINMTEDCKFFKDVSFIIKYLSQWLSNNMSFATSLSWLRYIPWVQKIVQRIPPSI